ncbi:MAG: sugar phosphate isomerase/epimerase [Armatimonadetes bacterium]|nr:sugar phosphate isomerase/epimerase [Armatimonadota bacterium]
MKLGYSTWGMPDAPVEEALPRLAAMGYTGVELTVLPRYTTALERLDQSARGRIRELLGALPMDLPAIAGHTSLLDEDPEIHAANLARLRATVDLAVDLAGEGAPAVINTTAGGRPGEWECVRERLAETVGALAVDAARRGVILAIEPHAGTALNTPERTLWLLNAVRSPAVKVNLDNSHFDAIGMPVEEYVAALAPHSVHVHVKDVRGRAPDHEFLLPGETDYDYPRFLRLMHAHGYDGYITVEASVMVQRRPGYDPYAAAAFGYRTLAWAFAAAF